MPKNFFGINLVFVCFIGAMVFELIPKEKMMNNISFSKFFIAIVFLVNCAAFSMDKENEKGQEDKGYCDKTLKTIAGIFEICENRSSLIKNDQQNINALKYIIGVTLFIGPYTIAWTIDKFFPDYSLVKDMVYSSCSPILLGYSTATCNDVFHRADAQITKTGNKINNMLDLCKETYEKTAEFRVISKKEKNANENIRKRLYGCIANRTVLGKVLVDIVHKFEKTHEYKEETRPDMLLVFISLVESFNALNINIIFKDQNLLEISGLVLKTCKYPDVEELEGLAVEFLARQRLEEKVVAFVPWCD